MNFQKIKLFVIVSFMVCFSSLPAFASEDRAAIKGLRPMSMGGAFIAVADDENAFFYNPAGITQRENQLLQVFSLDIAINSKTYDFAKFYIDNIDDLKDFNDLSPQEQADLIAKINNEIIGKMPNVFAALPNIAYISKPLNIYNNRLSFGVGVFSYFNAKFQFNRSLVPSLTYIGQTTGLASVPVAYKINSLEKIKLPGSLSLGVNFKYIYRGKVEDNDLSVAEFETVYEIPMQTGSGFGLDFGLIYHLNSKWNFGLQLTDAFYTNIKYDEYSNDKYSYRTKDSYTAGIRPEFNIGTAYVPEKFYYWPGKYLNTNNRITFAADIADIGNDDETITDSFWKKLHFGMEYKYAPFVIRGGFNSGYPTIGGGIATNVVQLEYAFYGEEEGIYAGQDPSWFHRVLFSVKIGHNKGKAYGKDVKKKRKEEEKTKKQDKKTEKNKKAKDIKEKPVEDESGDSPAEESEKESADDVKPADIPKDAKETISKTAQITEVN